ncbi:hypothetical protein AB0A63_08465 [Lentzea sp. NPDC042327]|uniref:hypothetical protein n=1 Tax=Lentzea sp. NPDC042327 TaxID=3154801 RepID=UPI0033D984AC
MRNDVTGDVRDNGVVLQVRDVGGDIFIGVRRPRRRRVAWAQVLLVILLVAGEQYAWQAAADTTFLAGEDIRPPWAADDLVFSLVADKLATCAEEVVARPANCPQRSAAPITGTVVWTLVGDPRDGMRTVWHDGVLKVFGAAVMTLWFHDDLDVVTVDFVTEVRWRGRETTAEDVGPVEPGVSPVPPRHGFELERGQVVAAVGRKFDLCTAPRTLPMEVTCPRAAGPTRTPPRHDIRWVRNSDPVDNVDVRYDHRFGLVIATGDYSLSALPRDLAGQADPQLPQLHSGNYVAYLMRGPDGTAVVLDLEHQP